MILRGDRHFARKQILNRLIRAAMAKLQFECRSAKREPENLVTKTNPEDWFLTHQIVHGFVCVIERRGIARTIRKKNSVGLERQHFFSRCASWHDSHFKTFLAKQAQNIFLYAVIVCGNSETGRWQCSFVLSIWRFLDRPWRAKFVFGVPTVNFFC